MLTNVIVVANRKILIFFLHIHICSGFVWCLVRRIRLWFHRAMSKYAENDIDHTAVSHRAKEKERVRTDDRYAIRMLRMICTHRVKLWFELTPHGRRRACFNSQKRQFFHQVWDQKRIMKEYSIAFIIEMFFFSCIHLYEFLKRAARTSWLDVCERMRICGVSASLHTNKHTSSISVLSSKEAFGTEQHIWTRKKSVWGTWMSENGIYIALSYSTHVVHRAYKPSIG